MRGQTNFLRMLFKFKQVYNPKRQFGDHQRPVRYRMRAAAEYARKMKPVDLLIHGHAMT
jgi:hypothetical protein